MSATPPKLGRPQTRPFTQEAADAVCEAISHSRYGLRRICAKNKNLPSPRQIMRWLDDDANALFRQQYARACARRADLLFDECLDIADDSEGDGERITKHEDTHATEQVARSKLRVDTRKWMAGKLAPKKYGERLELAGDPESPLQVETLTARDRAKALAALVAKQRDESGR